MCSRFGLIGILVRVLQTVHGSLIGLTGTCLQELVRTFA